jgi:hypothetical protein
VLGATGATIELAPSFNTMTDHGALVVRAIAWIAHSKLSNVMVLSDCVT